MGRGSGGSLKNSKRTAGGIRTSSQMSKVGEIEAEDGVLGGDQAPGSPGRVEQAKGDYSAKVKDSWQDVQKAALAKFDQKMRGRLELVSNQYYKNPDGKEFDPDVSEIDIERWERAFNKKTPGVLPLEKYKFDKDNPDKFHYENLHDAMASFRTKKEEKYEKTANDQKVIDAGTDPIRKKDENGYEIFRASNPQALSKLAQGSNWCVQNVETAEKYLKEKGNFEVIVKDGKPLAAIHSDFKEDEPNVWFHTDFSLRTGQNYTQMGDIKPVVLKEDFDYINDYLEATDRKPLSSKQSHLFKDREAVYNYARKVFTNSSPIEKVDHTKIHSDSMAHLTPEQKTLAMGYRESFPDDIEKEINKDIDLAILRVKATRTKKPEIENKVSQNANWSYDYALATGSRFKEGEATILKDGTYVFDYVTNILKKQNVPVFDEAIAKAPQQALEYATRVKQGQDVSEIIEKSIIQDSNLALQYINFLNENSIDIDEKRLERFETAIAKKPHDAYLYTLANPWKKASPIIENSFLKSPSYSVSYLDELRFNGFEVDDERLAEFEETIAKDPMEAYNYVFRNEPEYLNPVIEESIASQPKSALKYAKNVLKGRFEKGEAAIAKSPKLQEQYEAFLKQLGSTG